MKIGIDIGGSHIASGIVEENGNLLGKEALDIDLSDVSSASEVEQIIISTINREIENLLSRFNLSKENIEKIGIAAPGNPSENSIRNLVNLHIKEFNIKDELLKYYNAEIKLKNDGKCAGLAEKKYGELKNFDDAVFLCIGTGVGSAVFLNGKLLEPKQSAGFEFGHMIIEKDNGEACNCGNNGCFETFASMKRFKKKAEKELHLPTEMKSEELQNFIRQNMNREDVRNFVYDFIESVSIGISNIINIFEPEAICFGGSFSYYEDIFLPILKEDVKRHKFNKNTDTRFVLSKLKNDAGIIGAAEL